MKSNFSIYCLFLSLLSISISCNKAITDNNYSSDKTYDIVIYGATPSGIIAAVEAAQNKKSVLLIANSVGSFGGMTTNGLSKTDIGNIKSIGGLAKTFYTNIGNYYGTGFATTFEPKIARQVFINMSQNSYITILYNEYISETSTIQMDGRKISWFVTTSGKKINGKMFIDASYEGDLMALAGINYTIGRENNNVYNETLNGVTTYDYGLRGVSTGSLDSSNYVKCFDFNSFGGNTGVGDNKVQAYNFRLCMKYVTSTTKDNSDGRTSNEAIMIQKPLNYNENDFQLLIQAANIYPNNDFLSIQSLPNSKYDVNNQGFISTDLPGINYGYANGNRTTRLAIENRIKDYMKGFIWTLQNSTKIPLSVRSRYNTLGLVKDEFADNSSWPYTIYLREGRRMIGEYVMTEKDVKSINIISDPVGMGSYPLDCHAVEYGSSRNNQLLVEGGIFGSIPSPYGISFRSLLPDTNQCKNLLVPVCLSVSHVAFSSIRTEPVFMILGQSASEAACLALDYKLDAVQDLPYDSLKAHLISEGQILQ